jgi:hypothetical protein
MLKTMQNVTEGKAYRLLHADHRGSHRSQRWQGGADFREWTLYILRTPSSNAIDGKHIIAFNRFYIFVIISVFLTSMKAFKDIIPILGRSFVIKQLIKINFVFKLLNFSSNILLFPWNIKSKENIWFYAFQTALSYNKLFFIKGLSILCTVLDWKLYALLFIKNCFTDHKNNFFPRTEKCSCNHTRSSGSSFDK